jgi:hydantoinase/carbamoylase family amidase
LHGGRFDGAVGVVCALEVVRMLAEHQILTDHPVETVVFAEEEGSNFGSTMTGSKFMTGAYQSPDLKRLQNDKGVSLYDMARTAGFFTGEPVLATVKPGEIKAMIELHIEQGGVLEDKGFPIGVAEKIAGGKWYQVSFEGTPNHAGATPMHLRRDPMAAAAEMISRKYRIKLGLDR